MATQRRHAAVAWTPTTAATSPGSSREYMKAKCSIDSHVADNCNNPSIKSGMKRVVGNYCHVD
uniref:Uncharacterized protein n=2 Tax=Oryza sativa subsp. japonica TaxID=39947 RepID=Q53MX9_ORYSJ|nr:hypothetical protein [Oryza sativa Japonica Group]AAX96108.1 hypothetical protein LOC_Os11g20630 [Oryza sativa Japonica Group]ABA92907.1 hypothetical protein LOC_Os11g20630 [Oryza sativa Japonica Group]